jgi:hypothetical protein
MNGAAAYDFNDTRLHLVDSRSKRRQWAWTETNEARAADVVRVVNALKPFWPMMERAYYYRLLSDGCLNKKHWRQHNNTSNPTVDVYNTLITLLKWMRIERRIPWGAVADETRTLTPKPGFEDARAFIRQDLNNFLMGYSRCVAQDQSNHIEIWIEKQGLLNIVKPVADEFCRRVLCCRGYNSVTFQAAFYQRATKAIRQGLTPVVLYFGDWDPSGVNMIFAAMQTICDELGLDETLIDFHRCGINPEHFSLLHENPEPLEAKKTDSRTKQFIERYGPACYELDAFHPTQLQQLVRDSIIRFTDMDIVACNSEIESDEDEFICNLKEDVWDFVNAKLNLASTFGEGE